MIKKFLLSSFVILSFAGYALYEKSPSAPAVSLAAAQATLQQLANDGQTTTSGSATTSTPTQASAPVVDRPAPSVPIPVPVKPVQTGKYKDGTYTGTSVDVYYGNVQVKAVVSGGKLTDVLFVDYPQDRSESLRKSEHAMPILKQEAISAQDSQVDAVSGATETSAGFVQSLASALAQA